MQFKENLFHRNIHAWRSEETEVYIFRLKNGNKNSNHIPKL